MYRKNVCCFIFNEHVQFLGCVRMSGKYHQCVQGGIEEDDHDIVLAAQREIMEEIGLPASEITFVQEIPPPNNDAKNFMYELAANANLRRFGFRGQAQRVLLFYTPAKSIEKMTLVPPEGQKAPQEFLRVEWMSIEDLAADCPPEKAHIFKAVAAVAPAMAQEFLKAHPMEKQGYL